MKKRHILGAACLFISANSHAGYVWTNWVDVVELQTVANGSGWYVAVNEETLNPAQCMTTGVYSADNEHHISIILTSLVSGKKIRVAVSDNTCAFDKAKIERVKIKP